MRLRRTGDEFRGIAEPDVLPREEAARRVGQQCRDGVPAARLSRQEFAAQPAYLNLKGVRGTSEAHRRGRGVVQLVGFAVEHPSVFWLFARRAIRPLLSGL